MVRKKKLAYKVQMREGKRNIIQQLLQEYDIEVLQNRKSAFKPRIVKKHRKRQLKHTYQEQELSDTIPLK